MGKFAEFTDLIENIENKSVAEVNGLLSEMGKLPDEALAYYEKHKLTTEQAAKFCHHLRHKANEAELKLALEYISKVNQMLLDHFSEEMVASLRSIEDSFTTQLALLHPENQLLGVGTHEVH